MLRTAVEHREGHGMILYLGAREHRMRSPATVLAPEQCLAKGGAGSGRLERSSLIFPSGENTKHGAQGLELSRGVITEHPGETAVGGEESSIEAKQAQAYRSAVGQASKQGFGAPQCILDPATSRHGLPEISHLLAQAGDLVDQLLLGTVIVTHDTM